MRAVAACASLLALLAVNARAQDIEPRAYSNAPVGVNFLIAGFAYTEGSLATDPAVPLTKPQLETSNIVFAYARVLDIAGKSAKFDVVVPYTWLSGTARYLGDPVSREVDGNSNPSFRLSVNLYGAPALRLPEFRSYQQDLIVGASLQVSAPWSQYDPDRLVNIGTNRWSFKPEIGISKAMGRWTWEGDLAVTFFTDNDDFFGGNTRSQDPVYSVQGHAIYGFPSGIWTSLDFTYFAGGRTTINDERKADLQQNWRAGATLAIPLNPHNSIKFYASSGLSARTGNNFDLLGVAWQYRWGGGL